MAKPTLSICLHQTSHPGNIGAACRAMKTMGVTDLRLVSCVDHNHSDAFAMACGADDILYHARCFDSLADALADSHVVFGLSARPRTDKRALHTSTELPQLLQAMPDGHRITFLFGNESHGLDNASLSLCHKQIIIPTNPDYHSLNLAQAVQVLCYIYATHDSGRNSKLSSLPDPQLLADNPSASHDKNLALSMRLNQLLVNSKYGKTQNPEMTRQKILGVFLRANLSDEEADLFCGIFKYLASQQR
jgi:TrmH family RNA methyltransferase